MCVCVCVNLGSSFSGYIFLVYLFKMAVKVLELSFFISFFLVLVQMRMKPIQ